ncbi:MAG: hypothetical protein QM324_06060 [Bacteroidota bacterium]|nr:hypothetical protein [Bacteroidota bacterium]
MPLRNHLFFAAFALASLFASASACKDSALPEPRAQETTDPEKDEDGGTILFSENFDACTMSEGPFIQSDNFKADCENPLSHISFKSTEWKTVATSHICSDEYMNSRGFGPWVYLFRVSERPGYLSCGVNNEGKRGIIQSPMLSAIKEVSDVRLTFDIMPEPKMTDNFCFKVCLAGVIVSAKLNGAEYPLTDTYDGIEHRLLFPRNALKNNWNTITVDISKATNGTMLYWSSESNVKTLNHGFYLDNIKVVETAKMQRPEKGLRVLFWNIQNGMWSDQQSGFVHFKEFISKYDPDVCIWCEAQSIYKNRSTEKCSVSDRYFPDGWAEFAAAYGHRYTAIGGYRIYADDYYPQVVTSKYPIETLALITETDLEHQQMADAWTDGASHEAEYHSHCAEGYCPVSHGAAVQQVNVDGTKINIITLHLWPHAYSYYAKFVIKNQNYDSANGVGGNAQREAEIKYICSRSVDDPKFASEKNWLMAGDFNARSRLDNWRYKLPEDSPFLNSHDYILNKTFFKDVIGLQYPGHFFATRTWANDAAGKDPPRYDFVYASPDMYSKVRNALTLNESYTNMIWAMSNYYDSSDHRPILIDFEL